MHALHRSRVSRHGLRSGRGAGPVWRQARQGGSKRARPASRHVALACLLVFPMLGAGRGLPLDHLALPPGSVQTPLGTGVHLFGLPADIRLLDIPAAVAQVVPMLTAAYPALSDLGVYPGMAVLSGQVAGRLWVVTLEPAGPRRTRGSISVLETAGQAPGGTVVRRPAWLPAAARLRLDFGIDEADGRATQQIWTLALSVDSARQALADGLRRDGWQLDGAGPHASRWARGHSWLEVTITRAEGGSGILLQRHDRAIP